MTESLRRLFDRAVQGAERRSWTPGRLGMLNTDGTVTIEVTTRRNWVYVSLSPDGSQGVTVARNDAHVPHRAFMPVKLRRTDDGVLAIIGINNDGGIADAGLSGEEVDPYGVGEHPHAFLDLTDTPTAYEAGIVRANATTDALEFVTLAALIVEAEAKMTPVDADTVAMVDSEASNALKKVSWANVKATLKSYFDTLYASVGDLADYLLLAGRSGGQTAYGGTAPGDDLTFRSTSNATKGSVIIADDGGYVGLGTATPATLVHAKSTSPEVRIESSGAAASILRLMNTAGNFAIYTILGALYVDDATAVANRFFIDTDGDIGVGTSLPSEKLHVSGAGAETLVESTDATAAAVQVKNTEGHYSVYTNGGKFCIYDVTDSRDSFAIDTVGRVGIGLNAPSDLLHIKGADAIIRIEDSDASGKYAYIQADVSGSIRFHTDTGALGYMEFFTGGSRRITILNGGDVGIGTESPFAKLHVAGDAVADGGLGLLQTYTVPHNTATDVAVMDYPTGGLMGAFLVSINATRSGGQANATYMVTSAYSSASADLLSETLFAFNSLTLAVSMDTTAREMTFTITQTNGGSADASISLSVQPLKTPSEGSMTLAAA